MRTRAARGFALLAVTTFAALLLTPACGQSRAAVPQSAPCGSSASVAPRGSVTSLATVEIPPPVVTAEVPVPSEPNDKPCTTNKDCVGACASFTCTAGTCKKADSKPNYGVCSGTEEGPHRCFAGVCYTAYDCSSHCGEEVALRVAAGLSAEFAKCKGKDPSVCRKSKMHEDTPFFKDTQRSIEQCMLDCGYPSLDIPPGLGD